MLAILEDHAASGYDRTVLHERHSSEAISTMGSSIRLCLRENRRGERTHGGLRGYEFSRSGQGCKQIDIHIPPAASAVLSSHDTGSWSGRYSHRYAESARISDHDHASTPEKKRQEPWDVAISLTSDLRPSSSSKYTSDSRATPMPINSVIGHLVCCCHVTDLLPFLEVSKTFVAATVL